MGGGGGAVVPGDDAGLVQASDYTYFRADTLKLLEPDLVLKPLGITEQRITAQAQNAIDEGLVADKEPDDGDGLPDDADGDGYVDLNAIVRFFGDVDPAAPGGMATVGAGLCPHPYDGSQVCGPLKLGPFQDPRPYTNGTDCALDGTSRVASGACFSSDKGAVTINVQLIGMIPLKDAQVVGSWVEQGAGGIQNGFVRGFLSEEAAKNTRLPEQLPLSALALGIAPRTPLIDFLPSGQKAQNPAGWWFTVGFTAKPALFDSRVGPDGEAGE
jgi:hypothetical protein